MAAAEILFYQGVTKRAIHDQKTVIILKPKIGVNILTRSLTVYVGDFFVEKYIDSKYWRIKSVWYILTRMWAPVKMLI